MDVEWTDGDVDTGRLGDVELVLQRADTPILLDKEASLPEAVVPVLKRFKNIPVYHWLKIKKCQSKENKQQVLDPDTERICEQKTIIFFFF